MSLPEYIGQRLRDLRVNYGGKGISQEALAKVLGTATNTISRWETAVYCPSIEALDQLAKFFGVSILDFFPPEEARVNDRIAALLLVVKHLPPEEIEELRKFAEFRRQYSGRRST